MIYSLFFSVHFAIKSIVPEIGLNTKAIIKLAFNNKNMFQYLIIPSLYDSDNQLLEKGLRIKLLIPPSISLSNSLWLKKSPLNGVKPLNLFSYQSFYLFNFFISQSIFIYFCILTIIPIVTLKGILSTCIIDLPNAVKNPLLGSLYMRIYI